MSVFSYNISITGDCSSNSSGRISLLLSGGTPPYTADWQTPNLGVDTVTFLPSVRAGLTAQAYGVRINDSTLPINESFYINIPVSSGVCCSILGVQSTTCALNNGSVTGTSTSDYSSTNFYLYLFNGDYVTSATTNISTAVFGSLTAGTYYMVAQDIGGCTGRSQSFIIQNSTSLNYGLYVIPNASCGVTPIGKILVTGQTGSSPYTYLWSDGQTGSTITGLTSGSYSVAVTDMLGCTLSRSGTIIDVSPIGLGLFTAIQPTCFSADGVITIQITGGTEPYYYSASTGDVLVQYSKTWSLSGLSSGQYGFQVTDAALCSFVAGTTLQAPQGISSVNVDGVGSTCSSVNGSISITVNGGTSPYIYTLIYPTGNIINVSTSQAYQIFNGLSTGTYSVAVQDATGCSYLEEVTLYATNSFTISTQPTSTTCNQNNGSILVSKTIGGTEPFDYSLDGTTSILNTNLSAVTFTNISSGQHTIVVTDDIGCSQTAQVYVPQSTPLIFSLYSTSCGEGSNGTITAFISSGTPPYSYNWSSNVSGNPQQVQVSGLTAGTYSVTVVDSNGCSLARSTTIDCNAVSVSYQTYIMGAELFNIQSQGKYGLLQMLNEGYDDIVSGSTNCRLQSAIFSVKVSVVPLGTIVTQSFFTSTSLVIAPSDNLYYDTVRNLLLSISGIRSVVINPLTNQITIEISANNITLNDQEIIVELVIVYDTICLT